MANTLILDDLDVSSRLSSYSVFYDVSDTTVIKTLDNVEHPIIENPRPIVRFSLIPGTEKQDAALFNQLKKVVFSASFSVHGTVVTKEMRVTSNLEATFLLVSVDGNRRYSSGTIELRGL